MPAFPTALLPAMLVSVIGSGNYTW